MDNKRHSEISDLQQLNYFLTQLLRVANQRKVQTIYRGDKLKNLFHRLNIYYDKDQPNYDLLLERFFILGEKSIYFYKNDIIGRVIRSDDNGEDAFSYVFDHLNKAVKSKVIPHVKFFNKNESFKAFFAKKENKKPFLKLVESYSDIDKQLIKVRYLTILHQLSAINYKPKSHLLSTSKSYQVAKRFSVGNDDDRSMILHAWLPIKSISSIFRNSNLPNYRFGPYNSQKEISLLAGIYPHYIIGLEIERVGMIYNPYLFTTPLQQDIFTNGFDIDQANFHDIIKLTNYKMFFSEKNGVHSESGY